MQTKEPWEGPQKETPAGPDFLDGGLAKSGTSWLYRNLKAHPNIFRPPVKEVNYFREQQMCPGENTVTRFTRRGWNYRRYRRVLKKSV